MGGVVERHVQADDAVFRRHLAQNLRRLLDRHPRLAGVHLNVEPWPSGHPRGCCACSTTSARRIVEVTRRVDAAYGAGVVSEGT